MLEGSFPGILRPASQGEMQGPHGTGTQENSMRPPLQGAWTLLHGTGQDHVEATPVSRTPASNAFLAQSLLPGGFGEGPAEHTADTHVRAPETNTGGGARGTAQLPLPLLRAMPDPGSRGSQHVTLSAHRPTDGSCGVRWNLPGSRGEDCTPERGDRPHTQITKGPYVPQSPQRNPGPSPSKGTRLVFADVSFTVTQPAGAALIQMTASL